MYICNVLEQDTCSNMSLRKTSHEVILFYSDECDDCINFMPTFNSVKKSLSTGGDSPIGFKVVEFHDPREKEILKKYNVMEEELPKVIFKQTDKGVESITDWQEFSDENNLELDAFSLSSFINAVSQLS